MSHWMVGQYVPCIRGIIQHGILMLIPLEKCVSEAMVDVLGRLLSLVQHMVVQKYGSAVALLQLTHTKIATRTIAQYKFTCKQ